MIVSQDFLLRVIVSWWMDELTACSEWPPPPLSTTSLSCRCLSVSKGLLILLHTPCHCQAGGVFFFFVCVDETVIVSRFFVEIEEKSVEENRYGAVDTTEVPIIHFSFYLSTTQHKTTQQSVFPFSYYHHSNFEVRTRQLKEVVIQRERERESAEKILEGKERNIYLV